VTGQDIGAFDPNAQPAGQDFDPLPAGWYAVRITKDEVRAVKDNPNAAYLWLQLEIDENYHPELKGRTVFDRLNLWNPNEKTVAIAKRSLSAICRAVGYMQAFSNTSVLYGKTLAAKLVLRADPGYEEGNEVKRYDAVTARVGPGAVAGPASAPRSAIAPPVHPAMAQGQHPATTLPPQGAQGGQAPWKRQQ